MLAVLTPGSAARTRCSRSATRPEGRRSGRRRRARGLQVAAKPDSHDICFISDGDTAGWLAAAARAERPGPVLDAAGDGGRLRTTARTRSRSGQRRGLAARPAGRRRPAPVRAGRRAGDQHGPGRPGRALEVSRSRRPRRRLVRPGPGPGYRVGVRSARTARRCRCAAGPAGAAWRSSWTTPLARGRARADPGAVRRHPGARRRHRSPRPRAGRARHDATARP